MSRVCILVHAGALFSSAVGQVDDETIQESVYGILDDICESDSIVVIDGMLSDMISTEMNVAISRKVVEAKIAGLPAYRLWGCDAGEYPYRGWEMVGDLADPIGDGQEEMAARIAPHLSGFDEILVTGAWATEDDSSGCVNSVARSLTESGLTGVRVSESALREPDMDDPFPDG